MDCCLYYWNSGIFAWRSEFFEKEMKAHAPDVFGPLSKIDWTKENELEEVYKDMPNISIDYALAEKCKNVVVVPSDFPWSDLGTWASVHEAMTLKMKDNAVVGQGGVTPK